MDHDPVTIALPVDDRRRAHDFYADVLLFEAVGDEIARDGLPEPLRFAVNAGLLLMLVPRGGFGWVIGDREAAAPPQTECVMSVARATEADVDALVDRAAAAGGTVVVAAGPKPWGYEGTFADPDGHLWAATTA